MRLALWLALAFAIGFAVCYVVFGSDRSRAQRNARGVEPTEDIILLQPWGKGSYHLRTVPKAKDHPDLWEVTIIDKETHQSRTVRAVLIKEKKFGDKGEELA